VDKAFLEADTGVAVLRVYSYILKTKNRRAALDWLASVYEAAGTGDITRKMMAEALPKAVKGTSPHSSVCGADAFRSSLWNGPARPCCRRA
jgi:hypothetical protein